MTHRNDAGTDIRSFFGSATKNLKETADPRAAGGGGSSGSGSGSVGDGSSGGAANIDGRVGGGSSGGAANIDGRGGSSGGGNRKRLKTNDAPSGGSESRPSNFRSCSSDMHNESYDGCGGSSSGATGGAFVNARMTYEGGGWLEEDEGPAWDDSNGSGSESETDANVDANADTEVAKIPYPQKHVTQP